ncbi:MAG: AAA family ATPase [Clostridia bacterium]|nr:AAA family ATPase [Clostridia bacterium]
MATVITSGTRGEIFSHSACEESALLRVLGLFPSALADEILHALDYEKRRGRCIPEEIRLRADKRVYLTLGTREGKRNLPLSFLLPKDELALIFEKMCGGSLYAYGESILRGAISLGGGVRVGICGRASLEGGRIRGVYDISSLNVRLPSYVCRMERRLFDAVADAVRKGGGVMIYSPPGEGKTTLLRSLCAYLSSGERAMRVSVVDSRDELGNLPHPSEHSVDILTGYPKAEAILMATAFMNPEVIFCDEIGTLDEARAILEAQNCGVPLVATAHGENLESLLRRPQIHILHESRIFLLYVGIRISGDGFDYVINTHKEGERAIEDHRNNSDTSLCGSHRA